MGNMAVALLLVFSAVLVVGAVSGCGGRIGSNADAACERTVTRKELYQYQYDCGQTYPYSQCKTGSKYRLVTNYYYWCHEGFYLNSDRNCVPCGGCKVKTPTEQPRCPEKYTISEKQSYKTTYHVKCGTWGWGRCTRYRISYRTVYKEKVSSNPGCCPPFIRCASSCVASSQCSPNPCEDRGICTAGCDDYTCTCYPGYQGHDCQTDIDECMTGGDTCEQLCTNTEGSYRCDCRPGYSLNADVRTCSDINECVTGGDTCEQLCTNTEGSYQCDCQPGYSLNADGRSCSDIDECVTGGDTCEQLCTNTDGSYQCDCRPGYTLNADGRSCSEINECVSSPCENGGTCNDAVNGFTCDCVPGYTGDNCQTEIDECESDPCQNAGTCKDKVNAYECDCADGHTGENCEIACGTNKYTDISVQDNADTTSSNHDALPNEFPWMVSLRMNGSHICGGAIVGAHCIITSTKCIEQDGDPSSWVAVAGEHSLVQNDGRETLYDIRSITISDKTALLKTTAAILFSEAVAPVCLSDASVTDAGEMWLAGWGYDDTRCDIARDVAGKAEVDWSDLCDDSDNTTVCVQYAGAGNPGCIADMGGPLVQVYNQVYTLVGVHWATEYRGNSHVVKALVYTDVQKQLDWILAELQDCM